MRAGARGERLTAEILDRFASRGGPTVAHDLSVPVVGSPANIDHVVICGRDLWLVDSKAWLPGFYWTLGCTRRGWAKFPPADKTSMVFARKAVEQYLSRLGVTARVHPPLIVVWSSRKDGKVRLGAYRPHEATVVSGTSLHRRGRLLFSGAPADAALVAAVASLVRTPGPYTAPGAAKNGGYTSAADAGWA